MKKTMLYLLFASMVAGCAAPHYSSEVHTVQLVQSTGTWDGQQLPAYPNGQPEITILRITIPPHYTLPMHMHPVINAGVLLKGQLTVTTEDGQVLHMQADDPIVEVVNTWHYGINEGDEPAEILVFYAGTKDEPITIKKTGAE
jgi:quercetin dioxygenase-like cupin family protein